MAFGDSSGAPRDARTTRALAEIRTLPAFQRTYPGDNHPAPGANLRLCRRARLTSGGHQSSAHVRETRRLSLSLPPSLSLSLSLSRRPFPSVHQSGARRPMWRSAALAAPLRHSWRGSMAAVPRCRRCVRGRREPGRVGIPGGGRHPLASSVCPPPLIVIIEGGSRGLLAVH